MRIFIAFLLSAVLGPGVGQLYNREIKKGVLLLGIGLVMLIMFCVWFFPKFSASIPESFDIGALSTSELRAIWDQFHKTESRTLSNYIMAGNVLWIYGMVDAAWVAYRQTKAPNSSSGGNNHGHRASTSTVGGRAGKVNDRKA